jgi:hypothetical protein
MSLSHLGVDRFLPGPEEEPFLMGTQLQNLEGWNGWVGAEGVISGSLGEAGAIGGGDRRGSNSAQENRQVAHHMNVRPWG